MSGVNYVTNPSFEGNSTSGWTATNATIAASADARVAPGAGSYLAVVTPTTTAVVTAQTTVSGLAVGNSYTATAWVRSQFQLLPANTLSLFLSMAGASGQKTVWDSHLAWDTWVRIRVSFVATATSHVLTISTDGLVNGSQIFLIDRVMVNDGPTPEPYFDGSYPQCSWVGNVVANPSFETDTSGWAALAGTIARTTAQHSSGTAALQATATGTQINVYTTVFVKAGVTYTFQAQTKGATAARNTYAYLYFIDASGTVLIGGSVSGPVVNSTSGWTTVWTTAEAPATAVTAGIYVVVDLTAVGEVHYVDSVMVSPTSGPPAYYEGSSSNASASLCLPLARYPSTTPEAVVVGDVCMNTQAWNVVNRVGRASIPALRGASTVVPSLSGHQFVANRPFDAGIWGIGLWVLGMDPDTMTVPTDQDNRRRVFELNLARLQQAIAKSWQAITLLAWQADGTVRTAQAVIGTQIDVNSMMGGVRGEIPLVFEILAGWWKDALSRTVTGTPSAAWSNQALQLTGLAGGTAPIEDAVVTVTGPVTNPRITTDSGVWVQCNATVAAGTTWVFDCGAWTSTRNGVSNLGEITHSGHARFLSIPAGELLATPKVTMTGSATSAATNLALTAARSHWAA